MCVGLSRGKKKVRERQEICMVSLDVQWDGEGILREKSLFPSVLWLGTQTTWHYRNEHYDLILDSHPHCQEKSKLFSLFCQADWLLSDKYTSHFSFSSCKIKKKHGAFFTSSLWVLYNACDTSIENYHRNAIYWLESSKYQSHSHALSEEQNFFEISCHQRLNRQLKQYPF